MTALEEALTRTQSLGVAAVEKAYVADVITDEEARAILQSFGCTDQVELNMLFAALDALKRFGMQAPRANGSYTERRQSEPLTEPQRSRIERDCKAKGLEPPDFTAITKAQASEIIRTLEDGSYDAAKWAVPF